VVDLTPELLGAWVGGYERAWRDGPAADLTGLFAPDAEYLVEPYASPLVGPAAIQTLWTEEIDPDEVFTMSHAVVAYSGGTGVVRVEVRYGDPVAAEYRDLWVVTLTADGRASRFEEWPFWPSHGRAPTKPPPLVLHASDVPAEPWAEVVRSGDLSAGIYHLGAGAADGQSPHDEDEVYVVTAGRADLEVDGARTAVRPGSVAYVPRRVPHRFVDVTEDLEVAVVFAPPESGV
jgi:mannose-6-phosphate isomerase-like protein (cupin superfamily)